VKFVLGYDAMPHLVERAQALPQSAWQPLERPTPPRARRRRQRQPRVHERIVKEKGYKNIRLNSGQAAEFPYRPGQCAREYRVVVVRKNLGVEKGEAVLFDDVRYFFYVTSDKARSARDTVRFIDKRGGHENDIEPLKKGLRALRMPSGDLYGNGAYMAMAALAWNLKAWYGLPMPDRGTGAEGVRMELARFLNGFMALPAQVLRQARRICLRLLAGTPYAEAFLEMFARIRTTRFAYRL